MGEITSTRGQRILDAARSAFLPYFGESQIVPKSKVKKTLECIQRTKNRRTHCSCPDGRHIRNHTPCGYFHVSVSHMARFIGYIISDCAAFVNGFSRGLQLFGTLTGKLPIEIKNFSRMRKSSGKNFCRRKQGGFFWKTCAYC